MILRNFHYFYANLVIFHWKYKSEILALQNNSRFSQITQGFEITQANFQKITQATGGFYHSQPPDLRTKKKPVLMASKVNPHSMNLATTTPRYHFPPNSQTWPTVEWKEESMSSNSWAGLFLRVTIAVTLVNAGGESPGGTELCTTAWSCKSRLEGGAAAAGKWIT